MQEPAAVTAWLMAQRPSPLPAEQEEEATSGAADGEIVHQRFDSWDTVAWHGELCTPQQQLQRPAMSSAAPPSTAH